MTTPLALPAAIGHEPARSVTPCNVYRDVFGAWRWEYRDAHGEMYDSLDSFETYQECVAAAQRNGLMPKA